MKFKNVFCGLVLGLLLLTIGSPSAFAIITVTDSTNIVLQAQVTGSQSNTEIIPDITGGNGGPLVPYTEVGPNTYSNVSGGRNGNFGVHNLNDGDVGLGNPTDGQHAIPNTGPNTVVMRFNAGVQTVAGIAIYQGYWNRHQGTFTLKDGNGNILGKWRSEAGSSLITFRYWLTFRTPVTTDRLIIDSVGDPNPFTNSGPTTSFREIQVFSSTPPLSLTPARTSM